MSVDSTHCSSRRIPSLGCTGRSHVVIGRRRLGCKHDCESLSKHCVAAKPIHEHTSRSETHYRKRTTKTCRARSAHQV
ncbi:hypothetical protein M404DRAFT_1003719 [Pisolithus tinctorius Marx 270]|uniref:Uncharacterized protein n=1 Tax=Pisolithus tinctorius Marx 270 TaxID=870435 RepID=A0A0C3IV18_PISTI|nr:hypothetical protein M404DRAFT_1003719 [Pisolithus tinctorius Marx 270]